MEDTTCRKFFEPYSKDLGKKLSGCGAPKIARGYATSTYFDFSGVRWHATCRRASAPTQSKSGEEGWLARLS